MSAISATEPILIVLLALVILGLLGLKVSLFALEKRVMVLWRLEAKVDLLLKAAGVEFDPCRNLPRDVLDAMAKGERIRAIKNYRNVSGAGLKEAMDFIDEAQRRGGGRAA